MHIHIMTRFGVSAYIRRNVRATIRIVSIYAQWQDLEFLGPCADTPNSDEILARDRQKIKSAIISKVSIIVTLVSKKSTVFIFCYRMPKCLGWTSLFYNGTPWAFQIIFLQNLTLP